MEMLLVARINMKCVMTSSGIKDIDMQLLKKFIFIVNICVQNKWSYFFRSIRNM